MLGGLECTPVHLAKQLRETMGEIMTTISAKELAKKEGIGLDALRARWNGLCAENHELFRERWDKNRPINFAQETALRSAKSGGKKSVRKSGVVARKVSATVKENLTVETTEKNPETQPAPLFNQAYLKAIVYGHAVLILADLIILYSIPGAISGLLVGFFMHSSVSLADRPELNRTSGFALWICCGLDGLAWFVHVPAFRDSVSADVSDLVTQFLAGVVCAMSFAALYALRDSKLD